MATRNMKVQKDKALAGRLGGLARIARHGNPGTEEGRSRGGIHSLETHKLKRTKFKTLKPIAHPAFSAKLAELCGIFAGDGHIDLYQATITTNAETDYVHAQYVADLLKELFRVDAPIKLKRKQNACVVVVSSRAVCDFLISRGMYRGNKVRSQIGVPAWILLRERYRLAFVRGLFDTDGCVYTDTHNIRGRVYRNIGMSFTNRSLPLLAEFKEVLERIGLHPTQKTKYAVFLRRKKDIQRYFAIVGSSNPKHVRKTFRFFPANEGGVG